MVRRTHATKARAPIMGFGGDGVQTILATTGANAEDRAGLSRAGSNEPGRRRIGFKTDLLDGAPPAPATEARQTVRTTAP